MKNTINEPAISEPQRHREGKAILVSSSFTAAMLSLFLTLSAIAGEKTVEIGSVLGKDADAFAKVLGVGFTVKSYASAKPGDQGLNYYARNAEVPGLGSISLLTDNGKEDGAIQNVNVYFTDKKIVTWQAAFSKLGIPSKSINGENKERILLPPINGKTWIAAFYAKNSDDSQGRPTLMLFWEIPK